MTEHVFLSYAREDLPTAEKIYRELTSSGVSVWFDRESLKPGERWKSAISQAIRRSKYFVALLSTKSVNKRGFVQRELREALEILNEIPEHQIFVIPVRLEDCMPSNPELLDLHFVDLFSHYEEGIDRLTAVFASEDAREGTSEGRRPSQQLTLLCSKRFGDHARQLLHGLTVDAQGNIIIAGDFWGSIDFGGGLLESAGDRDILLAKFDDSGRHLWSQRFGDPAEQVGVDVDCGSDGSVVLASAFNGAVDFGGGPLRASERYNVALAKFDRYGKHLWSQCFGDDNHHVPECLAVDRNGNIIVAGQFQGSVNFGGGEIASQSSQTDIFVAAFTSEGRYLWAKRFGGPFEQQTRSVAINAAGEIAITGIFKGAISFDGTNLNASDDAEYCGFLTKLSVAGDVIWSKGFGEPPVQQGAVVAFDDRNGDLLVSGIIRAQPPHEGRDPTKGADSLTVLARYMPSGMLHWSRTFGSWVFPDSLSVDSSGNVLLTGHFGEVVDFGQGPLVSAGGFDVFAANFTEDGNIRWSDRFGDQRQQFLINGAFMPEGKMVLAGSFHGTIDFGDGVLVASGYDGSGEGSEDIFLAIFEEP